LMGCMWCCGARASRLGPRVACGVLPSAANSSIHTRQLWSSALPGQHVLQPPVVAVRPRRSPPARPAHPARPAPPSAARHAAHTAPHHAQPRSPRSPWHAQLRTTLCAVRRRAAQPPARWTTATAASRWSHHSRQPSCVTATLASEATG
jgi:hypothetical protein